MARAREVLAPLVVDRPTMRICLLMADLEEAEHGATGRGREWLARATRAPRDPAWIADGIVSDRWQPISPVTGRLDAFRWEAPPDVLVAPELHRDDGVTADIDDEQRAIPVAPKAEPDEPEPEPAPAQEPAPAAASAPIAASTGPVSEVAAPTAPAIAAESATRERVEETSPPVEEPPPRFRETRDARPALSLVDDGDTTSPKPQGAAAKPYEPAPVIFPVEHAPDDPGAEPEKPSRRGLFG